MKKIIFVLCCAISLLQTAHAEFFDRETTSLIAKSVGPYIAGAGVALLEGLVKDSSVREVLSSSPANIVSALAAGYLLQNVAQQCSDKGRSCLTRTLLFASGTAAAAYECTSPSLRTFCLTAGAGMGLVNVIKNFRKEAIKLS